MGLTIATFVPDGIVLASDSLMEVRNHDEGFTQTENKKIFVKSGRLAIAFEGNLYFKGLPISAYMHRILPKVIDNLKVGQFAEMVRENMNSLFANEPYMAYVAGYDLDENHEMTPAVFLISENDNTCINQSPDGRAVYNFHSIGRNHWVNKIFLDTKATIGSSTIELTKYDIDFSKYSTSYAKRFAEYLIGLSKSIDGFSQLKPMIGGGLQTAIIGNDGSVKLFGLE